MTAAKMGTAIMKYQSQILATTSTLLTSLPPHFLTFSMSLRERAKRPGASETSAAPRAVELIAQGFLEQLAKRVHARVGNLRAPTSGKQWPFRSPAGHDTRLP